MTIDDAMLALSWKYVPSIYKRILKHLDEHGEATIEELAQSCHCVYETARDAVRILQRQYKCIRPASWRRRTNGPYYAAWEIGSGKGMPPPVKLTNAEKSRRHKLRKKALSGQIGLAELARAA